MGAIFKSSCFAGKPDTDDNFNEANPPSPFGLRITQAAIQSTGLSAKDILGRSSIKVECALAVSVIFTKATSQRIIPDTPPLSVLSTSILYNSLNGDPRFLKIAASEALPGDILIATSKSDPSGYA